MRFAASVSLAALAVAGCATTPPPSQIDHAVESSSPEIALESTNPDALTPAAADAFVAQAEKELREFSLISARAQWVNATYITEDTDALAAHFGTIGTEMSVRLAGEAARFQNVPGLSYDTKRKLDFLRQGLVLPAPTTPGAAAELNEISTRLQSMYGKGKGTLRGQPISGSDIEAAMGTNRKPAELKEMWTSWHDNVGSPMRQDYQRLAEIANAGAKELGYKDLGAMWRSGYDMPPDEFAALTDKIWNEVKPLYDELHCYTRAELNKEYGASVQPATVRSAPTCSATCGRRNGATSIRSSRLQAPAISATTSPTC
jgi:peptidyl-dipeptidase A